MTHPTAVVDTYIKNLDKKEYNLDGVKEASHKTGDIDLQARTAITYAALAIYITDDPETREVLKNGTPSIKPGIALAIDPRIQTYLESIKAFVGGSPSKEMEEGSRSNAASTEKTVRLAGLYKAVLAKRPAIVPKLGKLKLLDIAMPTDTRGRSLLAEGIGSMVGKIVRQNRGECKDMEVRKRDREIKLLQQCLMELELEYFRVQTENEMLRQDRETTEKNFLEPFYQEQREVARRLSAFEELERANYQHVRQFQDQVSVKAFNNAVQAQNNALLVASGAALNSRPTNDALYMMSQKRTLDDDFYINQLSDRLKRARALDDNSIATDPFMISSRDPALGDKTYLTSKAETDVLRDRLLTRGAV